MKHLLVRKYWSSSFMCAQENDWRPLWMFFFLTGIPPTSKKGLLKWVFPPWEVWGCRWWPHCECRTAPRRWVGKLLLSAASSSPHTAASRPLPRRRWRGGPEWRWGPRWPRCWGPWKRRANTQKMRRYMKKRFAQRIPSLSTTTQSNKWSSYPELDIASQNAEESRLRKMLLKINFELN